MTLKLPEVKICLPDIRSVLCWALENYMLAGQPLRRIP